jgi:hypothetical protein
MESNCENDLIVDFGPSEKLAILRVLDELMRQDGKTTAEEIDYINAIATKLNVPSNMLQESKNLNMQVAIGELGGMNFEKKKIFSTYMDELSMADGELSPEELDLITDTLAAINYQ